MPFSTRTKYRGPYFPQDQVTYSCFAGESTTITCQGDETWTQKPICAGLFCSVWSVYQEPLWFPGDLQVCITEQTGNFLENNILFCLSDIVVKSVPLGCVNNFVYWWRKCQNSCIHDTVRKLYMQHKEEVPISFLCEWNLFTQNQHNIFCFPATPIPTRPPSATEGPDSGSMFVINKAKSPCCSCFEAA